MTAEKENGENFLYWHRNWISTPKWEKFLRASQRFLFASSMSFRFLSFGIYQLKWNLCRKLYKNVFILLTRNRRQKRNMKASEPKWRFIDEICFNYLNSPRKMFSPLFLEATRLWIATWAFNRRQHSFDSSLEHKNFSTRIITFMLSVSKRLNTNGIPKVEHVMHEAVDESESVDSGSDSDCAKPRWSNVGSCSVSKRKLFVTMDGEGARHSVRGASTVARLFGLRLLSWRSNYLWRWRFHRLDRWGTHIFLRE